MSNVDVEDPKVLFRFSAYGAISKNVLFSINRTPNVRVRPPPPPPCTAPLATSTPPPTLYCSLFSVFVRCVCVYVVCSQFSTWPLLSVLCSHSRPCQRGRTRSCAPSQPPVPAGRTNTRPQERANPARARAEWATRRLALSAVRPPLLSPPPPPALYPTVFPCPLSTTPRAPPRSSVRAPPPPPSTIHHTPLSNSFPKHAAHSLAPPPITSSSLPPLLFLTVAHLLITSSSPSPLHPPYLGVESVSVDRHGTLLVVVERDHYRIRRARLVVLWRGSGLGRWVGLVGWWVGGLGGWVLGVGFVVGASLPCGVAA